MDLCWLGSIIAAILSSTITFLVTYLSWKRKRVTFLRSDTEDLSLFLGRERQLVTFKITDEEWFNINRATVVVKNTGNASIKDFHFDIEIPGTHNHYRAGIANVSPKMQHDDIKITWDDPPRFVNPLFHVDMTFLNKNEAVELFFVFEGSADNCEIHCRMEDLVVQVKEFQKWPPA